ncbi:MAG: hypothetical protein HQ522_06875 [Bacteroidetes bacterium]|nr:hypothetical protein [Bacteroidota bacterium]
MKDFKEFNIKPNATRFVGDKIKMSRVLNKKVTVQDFKIEPSKYPKKEGDKCLTIQIEINGEKHILFTSSSVLTDQIQQVNKNDFPFSSVIVQEGESFEFR